MTHVNHVNDSSRCAAFSHGAVLQGLDFWWFDCHWHDLIPGIQCPGKSRGCPDGVDYASWGQYVEWSIMKKAGGGGKRIMMLGCQNPNMHRASHRTPVWWTGDNKWDALALGVQQTVNTNKNAVLAGVRHSHRCVLGRSMQAWTSSRTCIRTAQGTTARALGCRSSPTAAPTPGGISARYPT